MGGNKKFVVVPHYGVNTSFKSFDEMRVRIRENQLGANNGEGDGGHNVPQDACDSLSTAGFAPANDLNDKAFTSLFPTDPDTCMSLLCNDPSGNVAEHKWYLDLGEMYHYRGSIFADGFEIDNSMVNLHFPPALLAVLQKRADMQPGTA